MSTYICNICHKSFNSNQHLKQHKNKKNPCYNAAVSAKQPELDASILGSLQNTYLSDFIVTYQKLVVERDSITKLIEEYKAQKAELMNENKLLKNKLKSISHIINNSNNKNINKYDSDDNSEDFITINKITPINTKQHTNNMPNFAKNLYFSDLDYETDMPNSIESDITDVSLGSNILHSSNISKI
jgi:hypothetical protein